MVIFLDYILFSHGLVSISMLSSLYNVLVSIGADTNDCFKWQRRRKNREWKRRWAVAGRTQRSAGGKKLSVHTSAAMGTGRAEGAAWVWCRGQNEERRWWLDEDEREREREGVWGLVAWTAVETERGAANKEKASLTLCLWHVRVQTCSAPACGALSGKVVLRAEREAEEVNLLIGQHRGESRLVSHWGPLLFLKRCKNTNREFTFSFACMVGL